MLVGRVRLQFHAIGPFFDEEFPIAIQSKIPLVVGDRNGITARHETGEGEIPLGFQQDFRPSEVPLAHGQGIPSSDTVQIIPHEGHLDILGLHPLWDPHHAFENRFLRIAESVGAGDRLEIQMLLMIRSLLDGYTLDADEAESAPLHQKIDRTGIDSLKEKRPRTLEEAFHEDARI